MTSSFYYWLTSDSSRQYYTNTLSSFKVQLPEPLHLSDEWEVALCEISYPPELEENTSLVNQVVDASGQSLFNTIDIGEQKDVEFDVRIYDSLFDLFVTIKNIIRPDALKTILIKLNQQISVPETEFLTKIDDVPFRNSKSSVSNSLIIKFKGKEQRILFPRTKYKSIDQLISTIHHNIKEEEVQKLLLEQFKVMVKNELDGKTVVELDRKPENLQDIFIYTDIVRPQYVGDSRVRLLRVIPNNNNHHIFEKLYYIPVEKNNIQNIEILLAHKTGTLVPFVSSRNPTIVVLHFKKQNI